MLPKHGGVARNAVDAALPAWYKRGTKQGDTEMITALTLLAVSTAALVGALALYAQTLVHERRLNAREAERFRAAR